MDVMERDPDHLSKTVKLLRKMFGLTQESLAHEAGLTTRTIEKIESGRHLPDEQTLRSIARALKVAVAVFDKPATADTEALRKDFERIRRQTMLVPTRLLRTLADFRREFTNRGALQHDTSNVENEDAIATAAGMVDLLTDLGDIWPDISETERVGYARDFVQRCVGLGALGYFCFMGHYRRMLKTASKPDLIAGVTLISFQPKTGGEERYAYIQLQGGWEIPEADRITVPEEWR